MCPHYSLYTDNIVLSDIEQILQKATATISEGEIITLKGTGGFHLMCDAFNENAVYRLRKLKKREGKPFAVMFRDLENLRQFAAVSTSEEQALNLLEAANSHPEKFKATGIRYHAELKHARSVFAIYAISLFAF